MALRRVSAPARPMAKSSDGEQEIALQRAHFVSSVFAVHRDDDGADECGGQQQAHDLQRQHVAMHQRVADLLDGNVGCGGRG